MQDQLAHLLEAAKKPNVTLQIIPYDVGAHPGMPGSFVYMEFTEPIDPDLVYVDTLAGDLFLESDEELVLYAKMFDHLRAVALNPSKTMGMITTIMRGREGETMIDKLVWFKSSYSSGNGACVECARTQDDGMAVRDGKHQSGPALAFPRAAWREFTQATRQA